MGQEDDCRQSYVARHGYFEYLYTRIRVAEGTITIIKQNTPINVKDISRESCEFLV